MYFPFYQFGYVSEESNTIKGKYRIVRNAPPGFLSEDLIQTVIGQNIF